MKELVYSRLFLPALTANADRTCVIDGDRQRTYSEHGDRVLRLASALKSELGIERPDRFAIMATNSAEYLELYHAAFLGAGVVNPLNLRDAGKIERAVTAFARSNNGGLIVAASALASVQRNLIIELAAAHKLPAVYFDRLFVASGGLISYGADLADQYRRAAGYVDRILKGEKPADLPIQAPTKYELVINLKTAKALGPVLPSSVLARADEVIE
jgi:hypothetical protein